MAQVSTTPFDTIESAQDFVRVLRETIAEARQEVESDFRRESEAPPSRHLDALQIALYNLEKLENQMARSQRILNDLRSLRRLLFAEREFRRVKPLSTTATFQPEATPAVIALIPPPRKVAISRPPPRSSQAIPA